MKAIIISLLKSFRLAKVKLILCVLAAALSAWGISTIVYGYIMTNRDFYENFVRSNPADLILKIESPDDALIEKIRSNDKVAQMERREAISARVKNANGNWMFIMIFGAPDPRSSSISKFDVVETRSEDDRSIYIEKNGAIFLKPELDTLAIQFPSTQPQSFKMAGLVHDPGQAPSRMEQALYGYTAIANLEPYLKPGEQRFVLRTKQTGLNAIELSIIGQELQSIASESGKEASFIVPPPGEHPHQGIVDSIAFLQESFGAILSLLGAILLSLILITWLYPQIPSIGIMKAVGSSTRMIFLGYTFILILIIALGLAIGLPLGYRTATFYSASIAFIQNFTPITTPLPIIDHLVTIIPVILIPYLFALSPMLRASRMSVQSAITAVFSTPYQRIFNFTQKSFADTRHKYSLNNLFRNNQRTTLLVILLIAGAALFTTGTNLRYSLQKDFRGYAGDAGYAITAYLKDTATTHIDYLDKLPFIERTSYLRARPIRFQLKDQVKEEGTALRTYEPGYEFDQSRIIEGEWKADCPTCLYINQRLQEDFKNTPIGTEIEIRFQNNSSKKYIYSGVLKDIAHAGFFVFSDVPNASFNEVAIKLKDNYSSQDAARQIDDVFLDNDVEVSQIGDLNTRLAALENHLAPMYLVIQVMGIVTMLVALTGLVIVLNLSLQERAREIGIMKSLGGSKRSIVNMYHLEYVIITTLALVIGLVLGNILNAAICNLFGTMVLNVPVPPENDVLWLAVGGATVLIIQALVIAVYVRVKVTATSRQLLSEVY